MAKRFATCQACTTTRHVFHGHLKVALYTQGILAVDILGPRLSTNTPSSAWTFSLGADESSADSFRHYWERFVKEAL
jgi:hypothetical protein